MAQHWQCVTFNARGYPPSGYSGERRCLFRKITAARDIGAVLDGLKLETAHIIGVSMGSASTLQFASPTRNACARSP